MRYHKKNITKLSTFYISKSQQIFAEFFDSLWNWSVFRGGLLSLQCFAMFFFVPNWNYYYSSIRCGSFLSFTHRVNVEGSALSNIKRKICQVTINFSLLNQSHFHKRRRRSTFLTKRRDHLNFEKTWPTLKTNPKGNYQFID